ncbi:MAG: DNA gyrase/topoisomerase IV subunit A, partial [Robiginitalea sp.]
TYNMIYKEGKGGAAYVKRFNVTSITRDRMYSLTGDKAGAQVLYFSANPNGEAEVVTVLLRQKGSIKKLKWDLDFADVLIKGRNAKGNIVTKYPIKRIELKEKGLSTLKPRKIWFDDTVQRLNVDGRGELLGEFTPEDRLLVLTQKGIVKTPTPELTMHFDADMIVLEKWIPEKPLTAIYWEGEKELFYVKRFLIENPEKEECILTDHPKTYLEAIFTDYRPVAELVFAKKRGQERRGNQTIDLEDFIGVKGITAMGNQLTREKVLEIEVLPPLPFEAPEKKAARDIEVVGEDIILPEADLKGGASDADEDSDSDTKGPDQPTLF